MIERVNLAENFARIGEHWSPKIAGQVNETAVKLVKIRGEFVWHHHANEDEMFLVVKGGFMMRLRDGDVRVGEGEFVIVPRGVEHCPVAAEECHILLIEPASTVNTGNVRNERTREDLGRV